jgi:hypothetical protein
MSNVISFFQARDALAVARGAKEAPRKPQTDVEICEEIIFSRLGHEGVRNYRADLARYGYKAETQPKRTEKAAPIGRRRRREIIPQ